jgi:hypothetical protein
MSLLTTFAITCSMKLASYITANKSKQGKISSMWTFVNVKWKSNLLKPSEPFFDHAWHASKD